MKLYNHTRCPSEILRPLLVAAGRAVGARTGKVAVKVTQGRRGRIRGTAHNCLWVKRWHLIGKPRMAGKHSSCIELDGGYIELVLPRCRDGGDSLNLAEGFFWVAAHEWGHIADYQAIKPLPFSQTGAGGRRPAHDARPEELRANRYAAEAMSRLSLKAQDAILALAEWLDET